MKFCNIFNGFIGPNLLTRLSANLQTAINHNFISIHFQANIPVSAFIHAMLNSAVKWISFWSGVTATAACMGFKCARIIIRILDVSSPWRFCVDKMFDEVCTTDNKIIGLSNGYCWRNELLSIEAHAVCSCHDQLIIDEKGIKGESSSTKRPVTNNNNDTYSGRTKSLCSMSAAINRYRDYRRTGNGE